MEQSEAGNTLEPAAIAGEIDRRIRALPDQSTEPVRAVRREYSRRLRGLSATEMLAVAMALVGRQRWVAYELLYAHPSRLAGIALDDVERLGEGINGWDSVDAFARYVSGPAWQRGLIPDEAIHRWAVSPDRYWRRAALVSTVPLNLRAAGGTGDTARTLAVCALLVADHDDTIVKALSWSLRELALWDPDAVRAFIAANQDVLAARVKREVRNKLETGLKNPARKEAGREGAS
jgi:3-methyladenine DNA glycosylase AlkD